MDFHVFRPFKMPGFFRVAVPFNFWGGSFSNYQPMFPRDVFGKKNNFSNFCARNHEVFTKLGQCIIDSASSIQRFIAAACIKLLIDIAHYIFFLILSTSQK